MITVTGVALNFGGRKLFENVNIKFTPGNCYGLIGANGSGKSTFLKLLSSEMDMQKGNISVTPGERVSFLRQDHYAFDEFTVLDTVYMGNKRLYEVMKEKEILYAKPDMTDEDGLRASDLECEFAEMNGWEAESEAGTILSNLGIGTDMLANLMNTLTGSQKVKVLLAQALFGEPDILLLDEPTNHLDLKAINWLENYLLDYSKTVIVVSHDRHFLNKVCTHIADIDFGKITS
jgi:ATPase subunit of ABC transporter with duplicated ATPase domains